MVLRHKKLVEAIIVAIENEQERLFDEDYLMDSKECIDVIREEVKRWNDSVPLAFASKESDMTTITDKKQYPSEQYLNELITNIEFAARAPVEVVRAMAAELQKRREADSAEPASNHEELPLDYLQGQKDGLEWAAQLAEANHPQTGDWLYDDPLELAKAIRKGPDMPEFDGPTPVTPDGWISCSERMPAQDDWILIYSKHGEYMAGQVQGEYVELSDGTLSWLGNALYWMPLPEPPQEVK